MKNYKPFAGVFSICLIAMTQLSLKSNVAVYTYIDGNNNDYTITAEALVYKPITKIESSSGEYDGGEPKNVKITTEQFTKIEKIIRTILDDKTSHEKNREMGFGTIIVGKKTIFIHRNSPLKTELENELKLYLQ